MSFNWISVALGVCVAAPSSNNTWAATAPAFLLPFDLWAFCVLQSQLSSYPHEMLVRNNSPMGPSGTFLRELVTSPSLTEAFASRADLDLLKTSELLLTHNVSHFCFEFHSNRRLQDYSCHPEALHSSLPILRSSEPCISWAPLYVLFDLSVYFASNVPSV
jgi:hypothetical protein